MCGMHDETGREGALERVSVRWKGYRKACKGANSIPVLLQSHCNHTKQEQAQEGVALDSNRLPFCCTRMDAGLAQCTSPSVGSHHCSVHVKRCRRDLLFSWHIKASSARCNACSLGC